MQPAVVSQARGTARVLIVVEHAIRAGVIRLALNHGTFLTRITSTEADAATAVAEWRPQLIVLDMDIGSGTCLERLWAAATSARRIPVIALTRRGDLTTKLAAFDRGVDDILTVPFSPEELVARTLAVMRRTYSRAVGFTPAISLGGLVIDIVHRSVRIDGAELELTSLEQNLLYLLAANAGRPVSREQILDSLWGVDYVAESNIVDRHVRSLRAKLKDDWHRPRFIATVPGRGYRFVAG
jgi:DNA-binding response OmpR family regulator